MRYVKLFENIEEVKPISLKDIKSFPYKMFVNNLKEQLTLPSFVDKLKKTLSDDNIDKDYGTTKNIDVTANSLIPTQSQIGVRELFSWMSNEESISEIILDDNAKLFEKNRLLIANRRWIIDGHH